MTQSVLLKAHFCSTCITLIWNTKYERHFSVLTVLQKLATIVPSTFSLSQKAVYRYRLQSLALWILADTERAFEKRTGQ